MLRYTVGYTLHTSAEFPHGVPCILVGGDSVLCEFRSQPYGLEKAAVVAETLNNAIENAHALITIC